MYHADVAYQPAAILNIIDMATVYHADVAYQPAAILNIIDIYTNTRGIRRTMYHIGYDRAIGGTALRYERYGSINCCCSALYDHLNGYGYD